MGFEMRSGWECNMNLGTWIEMTWELDGDDMRIKEPGGR